MPDDLAADLRDALGPLVGTPEGEEKRLAVWRVVRETMRRRDKFVAWLEQRLAEIPRTPPADPPRPIGARGPWPLGDGKGNTRCYAKRCKRDAVVCRVDYRWTSSLLLWCERHDPGPRPSQDAALAAGMGYGPPHEESAAGGGA